MTNNIGNFIFRTNYVYAWKCHSFLWNPQYYSKRFSHSDSQAGYSANVIYHGFNSLQVFPVHSVVSCAETSQLVMQELVMRLELYQLWAKQCPVDLTILFIHRKLLYLNISVLTHAKLPTYLSSYDISGQYSISWWKNIKNLSIYKNRLYKNFCTKLFEFFFWLNGIHLLQDVLQAWPHCSKQQRGKNRDRILFPGFFFD